MTRNEKRLVVGVLALGAITVVGSIVAAGVLLIYGLNMVIILVNYTIGQGVLAWYDKRRGNPAAEAVDPGSTRKWLLATSLVLFAWVATSLGILGSAPRDAPTVRVAAIRLNYPLPPHQDEVNTSQVRFERFAALARQAAGQGAQVLFTSEMTFTFDPREEYTEELRLLATETDTYMFLSYSVLAEGQPRRNQTVLLSPDGSFSEAYNKTHLPPGEWYDFPGGSYPVFDTDLGKLAALICHDGNYTDVARKLTGNGAQMISAGFLEFSGFGEQLWTNMTFRAVENHTAVVVTGAATVAAIIDPYGRQVALDVDIDGSELVLVGDVMLGTGEGTLYTSLGDVLGWVMLAGLVGFIVLSMVSGRKFKKAARK